MQARKRRWGNNDKHFGPLTFALDRAYRPFAVVLSSGSEARESPGCCVRFSALGLTVICELPAIIKPWRQWVDTSRHEWSGPNGGFWDEHPREYGFSVTDGHLHVRLGAQTHDSRTTQDWSCFLPWTEWRQVSHRLYDADLRFVADVAALPWEEKRQAIDTLSKVRFRIRDADDQEIEVETFVEERRWRRGAGWFRWLGYVWPVKVARALDMRFMDEVGPSKGSWKGGLIGTSIEMLPGEEHEDAFRRYCDQQHGSRDGKYRIAFLGTKDPEPMEAT